MKTTCDIHTHIYKHTHTHFLIRGHASVFEDETDLHVMCKYYCVKSFGKVVWQSVRLVFHAVGMKSVLHY